MSRVLYKSVFVGIAEIVDPVECGFDISPDTFDKVQVCGALIIGSRQEHEERRSIYASVIAAERHLAKLCHLALAGFMQNLPRFGVALWVMTRRLCRRQIGQHTFGDRGRQPE